MSEFTKLAFGEGYAKREELFDNGVEELNKKHKDYFEDRKSLILQDKEDELVDHIITSYIDNVKRLAFHRKSDLPQEIKDEVAALFEKVWKS